MLRNLFTIIIFLSTFIGGMQAQNTCVIKGHILQNKLRFTNKLVKKVYLTKMDEYDRFIKVDSVSVKKGAFEFNRMLQKDEPTLLYFITGFDNGEVAFFMEPGIVRIEIKDAAFPGGGTVSGTATNQLYNEYKAIATRCTQEQTDSLAVLKKEHGEEWMDTAEGKESWNRIGAAALINCTAERIQFVLNHNDSPLSPLMMEREIYPTLGKRSTEIMLKALSPDLKNHPYYISFNNIVRSLDLKVGNELPDITIPLPDGTTTSLSKFRGKYVLLDFWASWCAPCMREIPYLLQVYNETKDKQDKFVMISFSLDNKEQAWQDAIKTKEIGKEGWIHGSDLLGWKSPVAQLMGVTEIPKTILVDPEGRAISFSLRGEEMVRRIKQIMNGDLYYQNAPKEPSEFEEKMKAIREAK